MIKKIYSMITVAVLSVSLGAKVQAEEIPLKSVVQQDHHAKQSLKKWQDLSLTFTMADPIKMSLYTQSNATNQTTFWAIADHIHDLAEQENIIKVSPEYPVTVAAEPTQVTTPEVVAQRIQQRDVAKEVESVSVPPVTSVPVKTEPAPSNVEQPVEVTDDKPAEAQTEKPVEADKPISTEEATAVQQATQEITVKATAYTASCEGCSGVTATGVDIKENPEAKVIAVDPKVIPLGSTVYVEGYGQAIAADTGGAIKGNRIDVFIPSEEDAMEWGKKEVTVKIIH
ncbi:3D domain-containing protein [Neobacillus sp. LXY-1]|uniref:3D domain-containing protein n=1 Tax=Neobacillus sp. LXY-1 TaxID=3379133 RepID=UPI003EE3EA0E